ncbi:MAG: flagellar type III secretion system pore protein FliP [Halanaerobiaceae bacterium]
MIKRLFLVFLVLLMILMVIPEGVRAQEFEFPDINFEISSSGEAEEADDLVMSLRILLLLTVLALAPSILILVTSFTRIIIVFSIIKRALGLQNMPPNQVLIGLAIFLTVFIMSPVWQEINENALQPYMEEEISTEQAYENSVQPLREFMLAQTDDKSMSLFVNLSDMEQPETEDDLPTHILIPSFVMHELKLAFQIGFIIYIPFLMIDMIVASILMSMGMLMLPPVIISLPFKVLMFVLVDGWYLLIESLISTF